MKLLLEATDQREVPIYVVITMRSDFLGDCAQFRDLPAALNDGQYLIPRMTRDQRREAITGPVAVGGATIAPRLVQRLLNDVGDDPDHLPVLQHALMRTWEAWQSEGRPEAPIDLQHYAPSESSPKRSPIMPTRPTASFPTSGSGSSRNGCSSGSASAA